MTMAATAATAEISSDERSFSEENMLSTTAAATLPVLLKYCSLK